jgi:Flp pilus assembly protein TadG
MIELALTLPFIAVVVFGTVDLGRGLALRNRLTSMAREGAFYAQFRPNDVVGCVPTSITSIAGYEDLAITNESVTVTNAATGTAIPNNCGAAPVGGTRVRVYVSAPLTIYTPIVGAFVGNTVTVGSSTEVVVQG